MHQHSFYISSARLVDRLMITVNVLRKPERCLVLLLAFLLCACGEEPILHHLDEISANTAVSLLLESELHPKKISDGEELWNIEVHQEEVGKALAVLARDHSFTRTLKRPEVAAADTSSAGIFSSKEERERQISLAAGNEIAQSLRLFPGVLEAKVHLHREPQANILRSHNDGIKGSASIVLVTDDSFTTSKEELLTLVSRASGIETTKISLFSVKQGSNQQRTNQNLVAADDELPSTATTAPIALKSVKPSPTSGEQPSEGELGHFALELISKIPVAFLFYLCIGVLTITMLVRMGRKRKSLDDAQLLES